MIGLIVRSTRRQTISVAHLILVSVFVGVSAFSATPLPSPDPHPVQCQSAEGCFQQALEAGEMSGTLIPSSQMFAGLQKVHSQFPGTIWAKRAGVRIGILLKDSAPADAITFFRHAREDFPDLQDYLNFWMAEALLDAHQPHEAAKLFEMVGNEGSQSSLSNEAMLLAGQAYRDAGDCQLAIHWLRLAIKKQHDSSQAARALLEVGKCELALSRFDAAQQAFQEVWWKYPAEPEAKVAQAMLKKLPEANQRKPTLNERYNRAFSLYKAAEFNEAVVELRQYLRQVTKGEKHDEAKFKLAMALARLKQYDKAEKVFSQVSQSHSRRKQEGLVWLARSYLRQGKGPQLIALHKKAHSKGLSGDRQSLLHIFAGVWLGDQGKSKNALTAFNQAFRSARSSRKKQDALWRMTWMYYEQEKYDQVLATLEKLLRTSKDGTLEARALYWKGRIYEQLQQKVKAQGIFKKVTQEQPLTYYGQLAKARLLDQTSIVNVDMRDRSSLPHSPSESSGILQDLHYGKVHELIGLGLFLEAAEELKAVTRRSKTNTQDLNQIIPMAQQTGAFDLGIRLAIRHFGEKMKQDQIPRSSFVWNGAYPTGYISTIQQYAPAGLDPYLVAGLIREESLYDSRAMSRVGALGLMQLMPKTASKVARRLGLSSPGKNELFDAKTNIRLGTTYVGQLLGQFNGNLVHTVAAYNAGPHVVRRWIAQVPDAEPDEFVERISYRETRGYVKRVLGSYRVYRALASQSCQAVSLDRMC